MMMMIIKILSHHLIFGIPRYSQWNITTTFWKFRVFITIKAPIADAFVRAEHPTLEAFAILLLAPRLLASTPFSMRTGVFRYLGLECLRVPFKNRLHGSFPLFVTICIAAVLAITVGATTKT
jgi:hypothetical protein